MFKSTTSYIHTYTDSLFLAVGHFDSLTLDIQIILKFSIQMSYIKQFNIQMILTFVIQLWNIKHFAVQHSYHSTFVI